MIQKSSINKVILVGHIGNKPEGRYTPSGTSTASFSLATNESWLDSNNIKQERTEWHSIIAWNKLADFATKYLQKGQLIYLEGRIHTRTYTNTTEKKIKVTEIIATTITPLEWKIDNKKEDENNIDQDKSKIEKSLNEEEHNNEEDLPF